MEINKDALASYIRIPKETPPVFLVHASDDTMAGAENSVVLYLALKRANVATDGERRVGVASSNGLHAALQLDRSACSTRSMQAACQPSKLVAA